MSTVLADRDGGASWQMDTRTPSYRGHRFPAEIISHAVWLYYRFSLSFQDIDEIREARGRIDSGQEFVWFAPYVDGRQPAPPTGA